MQYRIDSVIEYQPTRFTTRKVRVTNREADMKHGEPGFDGVVIEGPEAGMVVWGYDDEITRVVTR